MFGVRPHPLAALERALGHRFRDRSLLETALTHPSFRFEHPEAAQDNQRLEFLGDAVIGLFTADYVCRLAAAGDEGRLTVLRSRAISDRALAAVAHDLDLGRYLRVGRGEEQTGGRRRHRNLADAVEAVLGAAWLDGGSRAVRRVFARTIAPRLTAVDDGDPWAGNPKGRLQAVAQRHFQTTPSYRVLAETGPAHAPAYRVEVALSDAWTAAGEGPSKRAAECAAAEALLSRLPFGMKHPPPQATVR
jgi:ribonuclease-3